MEAAPIGAANSSSNPVTLTWSNEKQSERSLSEERRRLGPSRLDRASVLVIDEAGMVGTRTLARLLDHAHRGGAKVVLIGDHRQLPEIDAGGTLAALAARVEALWLTENRRQDEAWERDALEDWRAGDIEPALGAYRRHGRIVTGATAPDVRHAMVGDWWRARVAGTPTVMVAARRADVEDHNARARALLGATGVLDGPSLLVDEVLYQTGDRVMTLRDDRRLGVRNGEAATITAVDPRARTVTLRTDHDTVVTHAYAMTIHKTQGITTGRALVLGTDDLYQESGYVAMSRGRATNTLYVVDPKPDPELQGPPPAPEPPLDRLARHLDTSRAQRFALDTLDPDSLTGSLTALHHERRGAGDDPAYAETLDRLIAGQLDGLVEARTLDPTEYVLDELGPPPDNRSLPQWQNGARIIETYRCAHAVTDPQRTLGSRPNGTECVTDWRNANSELRQVASTMRALDALRHGPSLADTRSLDVPRPAPIPAAPSPPGLGIEP